MGLMCRLLVSEGFVGEEVVAQFVIKGRVLAPG